MNKKNQFSILALSFLSAFFIYNSKHANATGSTQECSTPVPALFTPTKQIETITKELNRVESKKNILDSIMISDDPIGEYERPTVFRYTGEVNKAEVIQTNPKINLVGFTDLNLSASASPSERDLNYLRAHGKDQSRIIILDLQKEPHPLVNGKKIVQYSNYNRANEGRNPEQIAEYENSFVSEIRTQHITHHKNIELLEFKNDKFNYGDREKRNLASKPISFAVNSVETEKEATEKNRIEYQRIPVADLHAPTPENVDDFIKFFTRLKKEVATGKGDKENWPQVHVHCMAGRGRTTTFEVMYDMVRNSKTSEIHDPLEILERHRLAFKNFKGIDLTETKKDDPIQTEWANERLTFIFNFFKYTRNNPEFKINYSDWIKMDQTAASPELLRR